MSDRMESAADLRAACNVLTESDPAAEMGFPVYRLDNLASAAATVRLYMDTDHFNIYDIADLGYYVITQLLERVPMSRPGTIRCEDVTGPYREQLAVVDIECIVDMFITHSTEPKRTQSVFQALTRFMCTTDSVDVTDLLVHTPLHRVAGPEMGALVSTMAAYLTHKVTYRKACVERSRLMATHMLKRTNRDLAVVQAIPDTDGAPWSARTTRLVQRSWARVNTSHDGDIDALWGACVDQALICEGFDLAEDIHLSAIQARMEAVKSSVSAWLANAVSSATNRT